jgi:hypothetical protein
MKASEVEEYVYSLMELKKTKNKAEIDTIESFQTFKTKNRMLYEMVLCEEMDINIFRQMMAMKRKLENGEDQYAVDVKVGQMMAEKYLDPVVKKLPDPPDGPTI